MVVHDNAYCELTYDGYRAGSSLQIDGAKDIGMELNSLLKTYNLTGIRVGVALGNREMIVCISSIKSHMDYGIFLPIQRCAIAALDGDQSCIEHTKKEYQKRRDILCDGLNDIGQMVKKPKATMFVWAKLPDKYNDSEDFAMTLAKSTGIIVTSGSAFGEMGNGYVRMALVASCEKMHKIVENLRRSDFFITKA